MTSRGKFWGGHWGEVSPPGTPLAPPLHLTQKCTKDQSSHFCDCFFVWKWVFQYYDRGLTKFHAGSKQTLACVVINNSSYPTVKNNNTAYHAFAWAQFWGGHGGRVRPTFSDGGTQYAMSPHFFSLGIVFGEVSKIKVMFVTFCVKRFSC